MIDIPSSNLKRLGFETASGVTFFVKGAVADQVKRTFYVVPPSPAPEPNKGLSAYLGTPIMTSITFGDPGPDKANPQTNYYIDINGNNIPYTPVTLDLVLLTVNQTKNIVKTTIQGRNGTVKEYVSDGDYAIELKGIVSDPNNYFPQEMIQNLIYICQISAEIPVISDYLSMFGIYNVVIETYHFPQEEGFNSQQEFTINMVSDNLINILNIEADQSQQGQPVLIDSNISENTVSEGYA